MAAEHSLLYDGVEIHYHILIWNRGAILECKSLVKKCKMFQPPKGLLQLQYKAKHGMFLVPSLYYYIGMQTLCNFIPPPCGPVLHLSLLCRELLYAVILCSAAKCPWALVCAATSDDQYPEQSNPELQSTVLFTQGPVWAVSYQV